MIHNLLVFVVIHIIHARFFAISSTTCREKILKRLQVSTYNMNFYVKVCCESYLAYVEVDMLLFDELS